jgi:flagellar biosynthetic protein FliR
MNAALALNVEGWLHGFMFVMLRVGGAFIIAPVFSAVGLPLVVRVGISGAIAVLVMASVAPAVPADPLSIAGLLAAFQEVTLGLAAGFILQLAFAAPLIAGEYIAASVGLGFAQMVDPQGGASSPALSLFLMVFTTLAFLGLGGHLALIDALVESYRALPIAGAWMRADLPATVIAFSSAMFAAALAIALPLGFSLFAINLVIGVMTRSAPQLNIFAVGLPITLIAGMVLMALVFPVMAEPIEDIVAEGVAASARMLGAR